LVIVATAVLDEVHGVVAAGVPDPVNVIVAPSQTTVAPEMVGGAVTVMISVLLQPPLLV
jgi:hypothetical protein